ncbi:plasmid pRiA4b ORF-3 family protein [Pedobacter sp. BS3]|uniref:IS1096 element passenger TnpR family protein n=1 Tax=Pedobacter sp. BS3 TaxID=2567937 RepID=UPI0011EC95F2|nr:plasmid pRiA4b ORF-3 family protein [Pedobacter sp. BS3]TZF81322.1 plasmid pRiA4b ORF-3 family protein [Pedobacter sp. BS3]
MAIYKFRVSFEDYDDIIREIELRSNHTFLDFHRTIHQSTGYDPEKSSSFYVSNDQWIKNDEIAFLPTQRKADRGVALMENSKLSAFIDDPHQKFYYTYNFDRPYDFHVELIKIQLEEEKGKTYPCISKSIGDAPKPLTPFSATPAAAASSEEDFDFLNETEYGIDDAEEHLDDIDEMDDTTPHKEEDDNEEDEFADNDHFDNGEDYGQDEDY